MPRQYPVYVVVFPIFNVILMCSEIKMDPTDNESNYSEFSTTRYLVLYNIFSPAAWNSAMF